MSGRVEVTDAAHAGIFAVPCKHRLHVWGREIGERDDAVRESSSVCRLLEPLGLFDGIGRANGGLDVDRLDDVRGTGDLNVVLGHEVALPQLAHLLAEGRVVYVGAPVGIHQLRVLHVVEVDVGIDELRLFHRPLVNSFIPTRP